MNKYHARRAEVDGISFASRAEARRYSQLKLLESAGKIADLELQPRFPLRVNGELVCTYVADFAYRDRKTNKTVVEDVKGVLTPVYRLKKKLLLACRGIEIVEVRG